MYSDLQYIHVMATSREMTSGRPFPLILNFAFPLLLGNLLQQTYSLMDAAIVGKFLGINALASVGASTSVVFLILGFCNGCCGGFGIPVAQKFGARDYGMMRRFVAVSLQLAAVMSVVIAIVTSMFCSDILQMMQTPENILEDAYLYLLITFIGVPCTFFYNLLSSIIRALGDSKTPFWFLLFTTILNILLDLFCILILDWGVAGAAVATVFSQGVSAAMRIKMFCMCPLESLGIAMATYSGQNYGAGKPKRIWLGIKASVLMMVIYCGFMFVVLMLGARTFALLFVDPAEWEILKDTELFLHISVSFFPVLGLLCILRYSIQGVGFTNLAMLSGVSEMIARIMVSLYAVPILGYLAVCFGDPTAWIFAVIFLIPAFIYVYGRIKRMSTSGMVKY